MADDPDWWSSPISDEDWGQRLEEARQRRIKARGAWEEAKAAEAAVRQRRINQAQGDYNNRNWAIWRRYKTGGVTLQQVGNEFGVTGSRVSSIVSKCDRKVRKGLNYDWNNVPDEIRDATLGVEFVFRNEVTFAGWNGDMRGWDQLELKEHGSAYNAPIPEWRTEWGEQDTKPAKPRKVYTYYKVIIEEGANHGG